MKMQEFTKGGYAQSRTVRGNIFEVVDVKAAEIMLKDARDGKTRIFWAPRRNFVPVTVQDPPAYLDEEPTEKVGVPVIVEPRLPSDVAILMPEDPEAIWPDEPPLPPAIDERELPARPAHPLATVKVDLPVVFGDAVRARNALVSAQEAFYGAAFSVLEDDDGELLHASELPPSGAAERDGHWTENVLTENPVEGRINVSVSHADSLTELSFILANAVEAKGFGLDDADPESPHFNEMISTKLMLAVGELAEAQEELRAGHSYAEVYEKDGKPEGFAVEIADAIYRLLHLAAALGIDIGLVLLEKHEFNLTRPYKHGKKF